MPRGPATKPRHAKLALALSNIIERRPAELKPWPDNPRRHSDKQLVKLRASLQKFGFTIPVLVDEDSVILSGHGRVQAAMDLGLAAVPTRTITGLTHAAKRAYVIADNKLSQLSSWDPDLLKSELELLIRDDFEIETTGFSTAEIDLMFEEGGADEDEVEEEDFEAPTVTRPGDLWVLGDHRLLCSDALAPASYAALLQGCRAQMCITDPPYNVPIDGHVCGKGKHKHREFAMAVGEMSPAQFTDFLTAVICQLADAAEAGAINCIFMDWRHARELLDAALPVFGEPRQLCVWVKDSAGMGSFYRSQHELAYIFKKGEAPHINNFELGQHGRYRTNVWSYPGANSAAGRKLLALHPTVKPVAMIADAMRDCSHRKGIVLDPFAGSGTVLIAAERTGRHARAIELDPRYVDVAIQRWQRLTGRDAFLAGTRHTWEDIQAERCDSDDEQEAA